MAEIIKKAIIGYKFLFDDLADNRTKDWILVAKPYQGLTILAIYLMFVFKWGPRLMKHREPYNINAIMIIYNIIQVILCFKLCINAIKEAWGWNYKLFCEPVDFSDSEHAVNVAKLVYNYYILKILDLLDTIFFVFRKKFNQVTFLHVYHHTGMVMLIWGAVTYLPGGHGTSIGLINCFVHTVMYTYYMLTIVVPKVKDSLWLKKYVTQLQILQFFLCVVHIGSITFIPDCAYPRWTVPIFIPQNLFMLMLFIDFYIKTYIKKPKQNKVIKKIKITNDIVDNGVTIKTNGNIQDLVKSSLSEDSEIILRNVKRS